MISRLDNIMAHMYSLFVAAFLLGILAEVGTCLVTGTGMGTLSSISMGDMFLADTEAYLIPAGVILMTAFSIGIVCTLYYILKYLIVVPVRFLYERKKLCG